MNRVERFSIEVVVYSDGSRKERRRYFYEEGEKVLSEKPVEVVVHPDGSQEKRRRYFYEDPP